MKFGTLVWHEEPPKPILSTVAGTMYSRLTKKLAKRHCFKPIHFHRVSNDRWHTGEIRGATTNHVEVLLDGYRDNITVGLHDIDSVYIIE